MPPSIFGPPVMHPIISINSISLHIPPIPLVGELPMDSADKRPWWPAYKLSRPPISLSNSRDSLGFVVSTSTFPRESSRRPQLMSRVSSFHPLPHFARLTHSPRFSPSEAGAILGLQSKAIPCVQCCLKDKSLQRQLICLKS